METATITLTVEKMVDYVNEGKMRFDNPVQRPFVWDIDRQCLLIDSLIRGHIIGAIVADKTGDDKSWFFDVMDGQQRMTSIFRYVNGEYELQNTLPIEYKGKEYDVEGCYYDDLPEELQKEIRGYAIQVIYSENVSQAEKAEMFRRLNNGKPTTVAHRVVACVGSSDKIEDIKKHEIWNTLLTAKGQESKKHNMYIAKIYTMLTAGEELGDVSFLSKDFLPRIERTRMTDEMLDEVASVLDYMGKVLEAAKVEIEKDGKASVSKKVFNKLKKEVHFISLVPYVKQAMDKGITEKQFFNFCMAFFWLEPSSLYTKASQSDTSKTKQICDRHDEIEKAWNVYFDKHGIEPEVKVIVVEESAKDTEPEVKAEEVA